MHNVQNWSRATYIHICISHLSIPAHLVLAKPDSGAAAWLSACVARFPSLHVHLCLTWVEQVAQLSKEGGLGSAGPLLLLLKVCTLGGGKHDFGSWSSSAMIASYYIEHKTKREICGSKYDMPAVGVHTSLQMYFHIVRSLEDVHIQTSDDLQLTVSSPRQLQHQILSDVDQSGTLHWPNLHAASSSSCRPGAGCTDVQ